MASVQRTYYGYHGSTAGIRFVVTYNYTDDVVTLSSSTIDPSSVITSITAYRTWNISGSWSNNQRGIVSLAITNGLGGKSISGVQTSGGSLGSVAWANNATLTLTPSGTWNTSSLFNANNRNSIEVEVPLGVIGWGTSDGIEAGDYDFNYICYADTYELLGITKKFILDAPPDLSASTITPSNASGIYWTKDASGKANTNIRINTVKAQYQGYVNQLTIDCGNGYSYTKTGLNATSYSYVSIPISADGLDLPAGTYTPVVTVTDSRGQTTTKTFGPITVQQYVRSTYDITQVQSDTGAFFIGESTASVTVSNISCPSGVYLTKAKLIIGDDVIEQTLDGTEATFTLSVPLTATGTFTPEVYITDSRNLGEHNYLNDITVNTYSLPTAQISVQRVTSLASPKPDDEGENMLITGTFTYHPLVNVVEPTVMAGGESAVITWYETYDISDPTDPDYGLSDPINWSTYSPTSPSTIYGFSTGYGYHVGYDTGESFQIELTPEDNVHTGATISATLPQAFFTVDFLAGGHGIAFGKLATDEGFECAMDATFEDTLTAQDMSAQEVDDFIDSIGGGGETIADVVIAQGVNGIWTYRKWSSGIAECWASYSYGSISAGGPIGGYYYCATSAIAFPFTFISAPSCTASCRWGTEYAFCNARDVTTTSVTVQAYKNQANADILTLRLYAIGEL